MSKIFKSIKDINVGSTERKDGKEGRKDGREGIKGLRKNERKGSKEGRSKQRIQRIIGTYKCQRYLKVSRIL